MDETQNDAHFVAFYDMHAVTFVPPDEMADVMFGKQLSFLKFQSLYQFNPLLHTYSF